MEKEEMEKEEMENMEDIRVDIGDEIESLRENMDKWFLWLKELEELSREIANEERES